MSLKRREMFRVLVDVKTGAVLLRTSLTNDISNASYRVHADATNFKPLDSPSPFSPGHPTPSSAQPAEVPRNLITLQAIDTTASPNGWINDGGIDSYGNNVDAHLDLSSTNPTYGIGTHATSATRVFDFTMDLTQAPSTYQSAAITELFYLCNWYHDKLYALGFTESAGNFQQNNFSRGGLGNDAVLADAQDGSGTNNANFSTPSDGSPGRMQMFVFTGPTPDRDGDLDAEIVIHEHTHGLSNRLVGGGVGISALQPQGMGEGWSDFYGMALLSEAGDNVNGNYAAGGYATYQLGGLTENYYYGIRRYPYSTDLTKNPLTLKDIDPGQASTHTGIPRSPIIGTTANEVHNMGEVWCVTLWEVRAGLVNKLGWATGNQLVLRIVTDGMKLSPANPTYLQARDAIIQADLVDNAGANKNELWAAFAKRGMGASATVPANNTTTGVVEAYDLPDNIGVTPNSAFLSIGNAGGPFSPASQIYTLTNNGATPQNWTASKTQSWLTLSSAGGTLAAGASITIAVTINSAANTLIDGTYTDTVTITNTSSGAVFPRGVTLRVGVKDYFTELFDPSGTNDVSNQSFLFTPNGSNSYYSVQRTPGTTFYTDPTGGTSLAMSDDTFVQVTPTGGVQVKLYGVNYASFYVGSNGYITFTSGDTTYDESFASHFNQPRISALMDDLLPTTGQVTWKQTADRVAVTWQGVSEYGATNSNSFQMELFFDGHIRITCLGIAATDGLIGLSQGLGTPVDFVESDFSTYSSLSLALVLPASASEGDGVLVGQGTVSLSTVQAANVTVSLTSGNTGKVTVPATVTVLAGQTSATFNVTIVDNALLDGTQNATITATAAPFAPASGTIAVQDNETAVLTLTVPATATEGVGTVSGTVRVSAIPVNAVAVTLTSSDTTAVQVPATVTILAGQTTANFTITVVDDTRIDGTQTATITAHVANWTDGTASIGVLDNESTVLVVSLPASVNEGGTGTGTVSISGAYPTTLTVALVSNNTPRLTVPVTVVIPAGSTSATFTLTAPNNALTDGTASVTVTASASGFTNGSGVTSVLDNDVHHYTVAAITSPQIRGAPFSVTLTAKDINNVTILSYAGTPALTASGAGGADSITPTVTTAFTAGVWTGNVTVNTFDTNVILTVSDGAGHTGASNAFNIGTGVLHHFGWNTQPAARGVNLPFSATVTAQDAGNNTVTTFGGTAALSAYTGTATGTVQVLSFTAYADTTSTGEYPNTKLAISRFFTNYAETSTTVTDPTALAAALVGKHVFLIVEQETATSAQLSALGTSWATTLNNFVNNGGIVIVCSWALQEHLILTNAGLMDASKGAAPSSASLTKVAATVLNAGVTTPFVGSYISYYTTTNGTVSLQDATAGTPVVLHRDVGLGHVVLIGTDFFTTGTDMDRIVANAVAWAQTSTVPLPMSPASTGTFVNGIWTGNITVTQTATQAKLRANDGAGHIGDSNPFNVILAPTVTTLAATAISATSATLHGTVNANGSTATVSFERGGSISYGTTVAGIPPTVTGSSASPVGAILTGLTPGTTYHFRASATNGVVSNGGDLTFTTFGNNANLSDLALSNGTLSPVFASGTTDYTASVSNATASITLTPFLADSAATVKVNAVAVASGSASGTISLNIGSNPITVVVTAQDAVTVRTYTVAMTRRTRYQDWATSLGLAGAAMDPMGDFNGNGVKNMLEWAFGTNPGLAGRSTLQVSGSVIVAHGTPVLLNLPDFSGATTLYAMFARRKDAAAVGLSYAVEFGADLSGWMVTTDVPFVIAEDSEIEAAIVPFPALINGVMPHYFRVKVTAQ